MTNGGGILEKDRCEAISEELGVLVSESEFMPNQGDPLMQSDIS